MKLKWKVAPAPTGRYRSFEERGWPTAEYENCNMAALIHCSDTYYPCNVKTGNHAELVIRVADYSVTPWKWRTLVKRAKTLAEAKEIVATFLSLHPEYVSEGDLNEL